MKLKVFIALSALVGAIALGKLLSPSHSGNSFSEGAGLFAHIDPSWIGNEYWYDGKAELNFYDAQIVQYGTPRPTRKVVHILVTEDHVPSQLVKADDWRQPGLFKMLKFNDVRSFQTGIYEYRQMMSVFFNVEDQHFAKMTFSSQEWCGTSFKEIVHFRDRSSFDFNTYWEGQGDGHFNIEFPRHLVLYDALPVQLRMLRWESGLEATLQLLPSQISSRAEAPRVSEARLRVEGQEQVDVPAGSFESYRVSVASETAEDIFWFEKAFPHRMLKRQAASGSLFELRATKKLAYWKLNQEGDEAHLP